MFEIAGLGFQILGVVVILFAQVILYLRARQEYGPVKPMKKLFIALSCAQVGLEKERLKNLNSVETDEKLKRFHVGKFLWDDMKFTLIGLVLTLIGLIIETLGLLMEKIVQSFLWLYSVIPT